MLALVKSWYASDGEVNFHPELTMEPDGSPLISRLLRNLPTAGQYPSSAA